MNWIEHALSGDGPVAFAGRFNDVPFLESWAWTKVYADDSAAFVSHTRIELGPLGLGEGKTLSTVRISLDAFHRPVIVTTETDGHETRLAISDGGTSITLPDGSKSGVPGDRPLFVLENNHPGHIAVLVAALAGPDQPSPGSGVPILLPSAAAIVTYSLSRAEHGGWQSPFGDRIEAEDSYLRRITTEDGSVEITRLNTAPPIPEVEAPSGARYVPPPNATFHLEDAEIEGIRTTLHASFARPAQSRAHAGVLILQGSGAVDRDGIAGRVDTGTHAFADALAECGATVLRYDKRGSGRSRAGDGALGEVGFAEALEDAARCLAALRADPSVSAERTAILGHSLGGLTALVLSVERFAGRLPLALLATPGRTLPELMRAQVRGLGARQGLSEDAVVTRMARLDAFVSHLDSEAAPADAALAATRIYRRQFAELVRYDPKALIAQQRAPVLICQGDADVQVDSEDDARGLATAAERAGVPVKLIVLPGINHLFREAQPDEGMSTYALARPVAPAALSVVMNWFSDLMSLAGRRP